MAQIILAVTAQNNTNEKRHTINLILIEKINLSPQINSLIGQVTSP